jgi:GT2 family glycosyltransferase
MQRATPGLTSVITVNFNTGGLLAAAARTVLASTVPVEFLVVDNASTDDSLGTLRAAVGSDPHVRVFENRANLGFARANNQALAEARGEWLLLLNPDCLIRPDTIARMQEALGRYPDAGLAGCLILNPDGTEQAGCRRETPTPAKAFMRAFGLGRLLRRFGLAGRAARDFVRTGDPLPPHPIEVEAISGAFMFARRDAMEGIGPLDEGYFLHCEDLDWCERFRRAGWKILFVPDATVVHDKGASSRRRPVRVLWHLHRGMVRFYRKFFRDQYPWPLFWLVLGAVWLRFALLAGAVVVRRLAGRALAR